MSLLPNAAVWRRFLVGGGGGEAFSGHSICCVRG